MKIWEIYNNIDDNLILGCSERDFEKLGIYDWCGEKILDQWNPKIEFFCAKNPDVDTNMPYFGKNYLVGDPIAVDFFQREANEDIEFLPIKCRGKDYVFLNVVTVLDDIIDMERSKYKVFRACPDKIQQYERLYFIEENIKESKIFRTYQMDVAFFLCTDEFKKKLESENIKGVQFRLIDDTECRD